MPSPASHTALAPAFRCLPNELTSTKSGLCRRVAGRTLKGGAHGTGRGEQQEQGEEDEKEAMS